MGSEKVRFIVHEDRLCGCSSFFKAALDARWNEGTERIIELPEDDSQIVQLFVGWLYNEDFPKLPESDNSRHYRDRKGYLMEQVKALVFTDKYDIPRFKAKIVQKLQIHSMDQHPAPPFADVMMHAYNNTCRGSSIRRFLADWICWWFPPIWFKDPWFREWILDMPDFAVDIIIAQSCISHPAEGDGRNRDYFNNLPAEEYL